MGSSSSKGKSHQKAAKFGEILVKTDKATYFAGDTVTGRVYIYMLNPYWCKKLVLRLKGKESVHFIYQREAEDKHREYGLLTSGALSDLCEESQVIIDKTEPLYEFDCEVKPDAYEIPFSFLIPRELPSTFHQEANGLIANIAYRIEAIMQPSNPKKDPKLKCKQNIVVIQGINNAQQNVQSSTKTKLTTHHCLSAGSNTLRAYLDKNYYCPGEKALIQIELDNKLSSLKTKRISVSLKQRIYLTAKKKFTYRIYNKVSTSLQGPAKRKSNTYPLELALPTFQGGASGYKKIASKERAKQLVSILNNKTILNSSVKSNLISSEYYLTITVEMDGACTESPVLECPLEIYHPEEFDTQEIVAPPNWNPHQMEKVNVAFAGPNQIKSPQLFSPQIGPSPTLDNLALTGNMVGPPILSPQNIPTSQHLMHIPTMPLNQSMIMPQQQQPMMMMQPQQQPMMMAQQPMMMQQMMPGPQMMPQQQPMMMQPMMMMPQQQPMMMQPMMPQQQPMMMMMQQPQQQPMMMMPQMPTYQQPMAGPSVAVVQGNQQQMVSASA